MLKITRRVIFKLRKSSVTAVFLMSRTMETRKLKLFYFQKEARHQAKKLWTDIFLGNLSLNEGKNFVGLPVLNSRIWWRHVETKNMTDFFLFAWSNLLVVLAWKSKKINSDFSSPRLRRSKTWNFTSGCVQNRARRETRDSGPVTSIQEWHFRGFSVSVFFFMQRKKMVLRCVVSGWRNTKDVKKWNRESRKSGALVLMSQVHYP